MSPLQYACELGRPECIKILIKNGANVDIGLYDHFTSLYETHVNKSCVMIAANNPECLRILLNNDAQCYVHAEKANPLISACEEDNIECVEILLGEGVDPNTYTYCGCGAESALFIACKNDNAEMAQLLIDSGADLNNQGSDMLLLTCQYKSINCIKLLLKYYDDISVDILYKIL